MHTIDFSYDPPFFHKNCEACDYCYALCPTRALKITNLEEIHGALSEPCDPKHPTANCHGITLDSSGKMIYQGFYSPLNAAEAKGKFRPLVPIDKVGWNTDLRSFTRVPLFVRNEADFPFHINEG
jgi:ferredoxin